MFKFFHVRKITTLFFFFFFLLRGEIKWLCFFFNLAPSMGTFICVQIITVPTDSWSVSGDDTYSSCPPLTHPYLRTSHPPFTIHIMLDVGSQGWFSAALWLRSHRQLEWKRSHMDMAREWTPGSHMSSDGSQHWSPSKVPRNVIPGLGMYESWI